MTSPLGIALNTLTTHANLLIETTFPDSCSITRPKNATGDYGTSATTYPNIATGIGCSWAPAGKDAKEYIRALKISAVMVYAITLPSVVNGSAIDLKPKDRIVVVARGQEPERTFEVKGPPIRNAGLPLLVLCTLEE